MKMIRAFFLVLSQGLVRNACAKDRNDEDKVSCQKLQVDPYRKYLPAIRAAVNVH